MEGFIVLWLLLRIPSESQSAVFAGLSFRRISVGLLTLVILGGLILIIVDSFKSRKLLLFLSTNLKPVLNKDVYFLIIQSSVIISFFASLIYVTPYFIPEFQRLVPPTFYYSFLQNIGQWSNLFILWMLLVNLKLLIFFTIYGKRRDIVQKFSMPARITLPFACISIWLVTFFITLQVAHWMNAANTPTDCYFNLLADSMLHGKLYLVDPPTTFDLTFYNGHWFVPNPPIPAIIMLPFVALLGIGTFNTVIFSVALAATTAVIIFLILVQLSNLQWIKLSLSGILWLVTFLSFGSVLWWLSITSRVWHISQVCTVFFSALAFWFALKRHPSWIVGLTLAAAVLSRPNVIVLWPALAAITIQFMKDMDGKINWKKILRWCAGSILPIILGAGCLLFYNYLRFGNFLDFGYVTINGSLYTISRVQEYGIFNPYFIPFNLYWMFLGFTPGLIIQCDFYLIRGFGMSMFLTSPALLYVFRRFKHSWWSAGCWSSILLSIALLAMYHNNGSNQYGYRYWLDFAVPVMIIMANNVGERISIPAKVLIIASILINYYGIISWFTGPC